MTAMKKGFYCLGPYIYYGAYPQEQVSGRMNLSAARPGFIKTRVPFSEDDFAERLYENHALTEQESENLEQALKKIMRCFNILEFHEVEFSKVEQKLGIVLPKEIKALYTALCEMDSLMSGSERFLPLNELYLDNENLVFYKIKRTPVGLSINEGVKVICKKKEWSYSWGDEGFFSYALDRLVVKAITQMPVSRKGKIKGELRTILSPREPLQEIFKGKFNLLEEYDNYGNIILINESGALGWLRQNGFYADILIGCQNHRIMDELLSTDLPIQWE